MGYSQVADLFDFIEGAPSCFHAVAQAERMLQAQGFVRLPPNRPFAIAQGGRYYVTRNGSSLIAFAVPLARPLGFQIVASHSDAPTFKVKVGDAVTGRDPYVTLNTEMYGSALCASWLDRPLSVAGRLVLRTPEGVRTRLVHVDEDLLLIPSLAIHLNRKANEGVAYNAQRDLLPLFAMDGDGASFTQWIAAYSEVEARDILGMDLYLYNRTPCSVWGAQQAFLSAPRLDDLACAFAALTALCQSEPCRSINVCAVFDNEEVGSQSKQGAGSTFLLDTLRAVWAATGQPDGFAMGLHNSLMLSADNAHAVHPNYADKSDPQNRVYLNRGVAIKHHAGQKYATDAVSDALFRLICERADVPVQHFTNRSDLPGGATLGSIANTLVPVVTVDIGLPQLAMHASYETAGAHDLSAMIRAMTACYGCSVLCQADGDYRLVWG